MSGIDDVDVGRVKPDAENSVGRDAKLSAIQRSIRWVLASNNEPRGRGQISPTGFSHTFAVCMLEWNEMARGNGKQVDQAKLTAMPTFVDIKLTADNRQRFQEWYAHERDAIKILTDFTDTGYRVGCTWSGDTQSYTVSVTCRSSEQPNNGLCMTSFAKTIHQGICLAWFKHSVLAAGAWRTYAPEESEGWG